MYRTKNLIFKLLDLSYFHSPTSSFYLLQKFRKHYLFLKSQTFCHILWCMLIKECCRIAERGDSLLFLVLFFLNILKIEK